MALKWSSHMRRRSKGPLPSCSLINNPNYILPMTLGSVKELVVLLYVLCG